MENQNNIKRQSKEFKCLIHLDKLSITLKHLESSNFKNIINPDGIAYEQKFNTVVLRHDNTRGKGAYYHSFIVYLNGVIIGRLFTGSKLMKSDLQFDFSKELFYRAKPEFWYEAYTTLVSELGIAYNNINYVEISVDTNKDVVKEFGSLFQLCKNNALRTGDRFKLRKNTIVSVMNNGDSFVIGSGKKSGSKAAIYNKSHFSEPFILDYFHNNGFIEDNVCRIEARLKWNYIRHLISKRKMVINLETLLDAQKHAAIFEISVKQKLTFKDSINKDYDTNRNLRWAEVSVLDDIRIDKAEIGRLSHEIRITHYKKAVDENIIRQNYYRYLESGNAEYLKNVKLSANVASVTVDQLLFLIEKFNNKYLGDRDVDTISRMEYSSEFIRQPVKARFKNILYSAALKMKLSLAGLF